MRHMRCALLTGVHTCALPIWHLDLRGVFFFKEKAAYETRISDWSSDVCSSDLVRFAPALERLVDGGGARIVLEVGPRTTLCTLSRQHPGVQKQQARAVATLADAPDRETAQLRLAAGQLWCHGVAVDPAAFDTRNVRRRVRLPTYPFERKRYWVDAIGS